MHILTRLLLCYEDIIYYVKTVSFFERTGAARIHHHYRPLLSKQKDRAVSLRLPCKHNCNWGLVFNCMFFVSAEVLIYLRSLVQYTGM